MSIDGRGRIRESVGRGSREEAARRAIERIAELERPRVAVDSPSLARAGPELIVAKDKAGHAAGYVSAIEGHLRNFILPHYGWTRGSATSLPTSTSGSSTCSAKATSISARAIAC